jgi:hypothetical protein
MSRSMLMIAVLAAGAAGLVFAWMIAATWHS